MSVTLILGGARSGKSRYAETRAQTLADQSGLPVVYLATATIEDGEMATRIHAHQVRRPHTWTTVEESIDLASLLTSNTKPAIVIVDCLSLLLSNWMLLPNPESSLLERQTQLLQALSAYPYPLLVVTNETGQGIVPDNALARRYRDELGLLNQAVARIADTVLWMVAGLPVDVRRLSPQW